VDPPPPPLVDPPPPVVEPLELLKKLQPVSRSAQVAAILKASHQLRESDRIPYTSITPDHNG
jgi:hypothetical protein